MTSVLIISDSHGLKEEIVTITKRHQTSHLIHCGDSELPENAFELMGFVKVAGNCDMDTRYKNEQLQHIAGWEFFITHGHLNQVKSTLLSLTYRASELQADVVCFGHTHIAGVEKIDGKIFINPGSIRIPKGKHGKTYAVVTFPKRREIEVTFYSIDGEKVDELYYHSV